MNKRIKELIQKADSKCNETRGVYDEILVSLVVKECARIAREYTLSKWDLDNSYSGTVIVEKEIKEHFGVE